MNLNDTTVTAVEMLHALRERRISAIELLDLHLEQIARYNPALNAIVIPNYGTARCSAAEADRARAKGDQRPLLGLPVTVKDWIEVEGLRSTAGDPGFASSNYIARADACVVARLKAAGAIVLGKTNMAPWGGGWTTDNAVFGRSNNPWDLERTPGGSTGGGAAAVAAGLTPVEVGNDFAGSVRIPPAFCGVYGHKPSETAWPRSGQTPDGSGRHLPNPATAMCVLGSLARCAEDLALTLDIAAGSDQGEDVAWRLELPRARHERLADYRVAILPPIPWLPVDEEILSAQERLAEALCRCGATVGVAQPEGFSDVRDLYKLGYMLMTAHLIGQMPREQRLETARLAREEAGKRGDDLMEAAACAFEALAPDYIGWFFRREAYRAAYRDFFRQWDVLVTPVTFTVAFRDGDLVRVSDDPDDDPVMEVAGQQVCYRLMQVYPFLATVCGQPATVFPCGLTRSGLPIGLQAIGPYLEDHTPLRFAALVGELLGGYQAPSLLGTNQEHKQ